MMHSFSARVVAVLLVGEALLFFASARWIGAMYLSLGGTLAQAFEAGSGNWEIGALLLVASVLYWSSPAIRTWLRIAAIGCGFYAAWTLIHLSSLVGSWNPLHGNIVALSGLCSVGLILIAVAAIFDGILTKFNRTSRTLRRE